MIDAGAVGAVVQSLADSGCRATHEQAEAALKAALTLIGSRGSRAIALRAISVAEDVSGARLDDSIRAALTGTVDEAIKLGRTLP